jgi:hypothetical protein
MQLDMLRQRYLRSLCGDVLGLRGRVYSNADVDSRASVAIADAWALRIGGPFCTNVPSGQTLGERFASHTKDFVRDVFGLISHVRPGDWVFSTQQGTGIAAFEQYNHLSIIAELARQYREIRLVMGGDYVVKPDIMVGRLPVTDSDINANSPVGNPLLTAASGLAALTPLRLTNNDVPTLHASISCKWTIRSDRAQNTRTEALNLTRNRKGRLPYIMVVTAEPMPSRLRSIALGTGDVDCTYHAALPELQAAVASIGTVIGDARAAQHREDLDVLIESRRLRDISDLPFDLAM